MASQAVHSGSQDDVNQVASAMTDAAYPDEPFACPSCGQMLAASCRVCVACKRAINPAEIRILAPPREGAQEQPAQPVADSVRFPWPMFVYFLGGTWVAAMLAVQFLGIPRSQVLVGGIQLISSLWVIYDVHHRRLPKPLRWGLGSLFLWIVVFPWYLSRRRQPRAACPFVEAEIGSHTRMLMIILAVVFLAALVVTAKYGPPR